MPILAFIFILRILIGVSLGQAVVIMFVVIGIAGLIALLTQALRAAPADLPIPPAPETPDTPLWRGKARMAGSLEDLERSPPPLPDWDGADLAGHRPAKG